MLIVVTYDIPDDKRRTRLHALLRRHGEPVQYSVFECLLDADRLARMQREVSDLVEPDEDDVRYYEICEACHGRVVTLGLAFTTSIKPFYFA